MKTLKLLVTSLAFALASGVAMASNCPNEAKAIDAALSKDTKLSAEQKAEVQKLRDEGMKQHDAGKHKESMETLGKAKKLLGI
ncbi:MAG TPA: hypothetical protein VFP70_11640 [Burkholderiales bacterium]|nr:hypothetical protein [Burkholderiales bacterium]